MSLKTRLPRKVCVASLHNSSFSILFPGIFELEMVHWWDAYNDSRFIRQGRLKIRIEHSKLISGKK